MLSFCHSSVLKWEHLSLRLLDSPCIHTGSVMPTNLFVQTKFVSITGGQVGSDYILLKLEHMAAAPIPHMVHYWTTRNWTVVTPFIHCSCSFWMPVLYVPQQSALSNQRRCVYEVNVYYTTDIKVAKLVPPCPADWTTRFP